MAEPDKLELPSEFELRELTYRANVAYAARCARRVEPHYALSVADKIAAIPKDAETYRRFMKAVDGAIQIAEGFATGRLSAAAAADDGAVWNSNVNFPHGAAYAAYAAVAIVVTADTTDEAAYAHHAASAAAAYDPAFRAAATDDYDELRRLCAQPRPIPASFFARPLWPSDAVPPWYNDGLAKLRELLADDESPSLEALADVSPPVIVIAWDPQLVSPDDYADLVTALGDVVRASGGAGLKLLAEKDLGVVLEGAPTG